MRAALMRHDRDGMNSPLFSAASRLHHDGVDMDGGWWRWRQIRTWRRTKRTEMDMINQMRKVQSSHHQPGLMIILIPSSLHAHSPSSWHASLFPTSILTSLANHLFISSASSHSHSLSPFSHHVCARHTAAAAVDGSDSRQCCGRTGFLHRLGWSIPVLFSNWFKRVNG